MVERKKLEPSLLEEEEASRGKWFFAVVVFKETVAPRAFMYADGKGPGERGKL